MRIYLTTDDPQSQDWGPSFVAVLRQRAEACPVGVHSVCDDPEAADSILIISRGSMFVENLRRHPLVGRFPGKTFVYDFRDIPIAFLPGLYCSLPRNRFSRGRHRAVPYLTTNNEAVDELASAAGSIAPDLFFSFIGSATSPIRKQLFRSGLFRDRTDVLIENTSGWSNWDTSQPDFHVRRRRYGEVLLRSQFVLCPRGVGTSTYRLFETMQVGRVPVILSDAWVAPDGPAWETCSVRIPERRLEEVPRLLAPYASRAGVMGARARQEWLNWFAPAMQFHRFAEALGELLQGKPAMHPWQRFLWPAHAAAWRLRMGSRRAVRTAALHVLRLGGVKLYLADRQPSV